MIYYESYKLLWTTWSNFEPLWATISHYKTHRAHMSNMIHSKSPKLTKSHHEFFSNYGPLGATMKLCQYAIEWATMSHFEPLRVHMIPYDLLWAFWATLSNFDPLWAIVSHFGILWATLRNYEQTKAQYFWPTLNNLQHIWTIMNHFETL